MARHRAHSNLVSSPSEQHLLQPSDKQTAVARAENIHQHRHHPHAKRGGQDEIFGFCHHHTMLYLGLNTVAPRILHKEKLNPAGPKQQTTKQAPQRLSRVAPGKHADDNEHKA